MNNQKKVALMPTGIKGFDAMMGGGIPRERILMVSGAAGSGKTVFLNEFLYRGITEYNQNGVFVTFEENPEDIIRNVAGFGWDYPALLDKKKLYFIDLNPFEGNIVEVSPSYDLSPILLRIKQAVRKISAQRVAVDSLAALFSQFSNKNAVRSILYRIGDELKKIGVTTILSSEQPDLQKGYSRYGLEEFVTDGVIALRNEPGEQRLIRRMYVAKMRGMGYRSGSVQFDISSKGMKVYPKIDVFQGVAKTSLKERKKIGIPGVDQALEGGIPKGHIVLASGNTGSGKTLMCMQFLAEGLKRNEKGIYVALEEPVQQVMKTADEHGWDFGKWKEQDKLHFLTASLIDFSPDKLLTKIVEEIEDSKSSRLVIDSISSILSATMDNEKVRQFLLQLAAYLKSQGITCILSYLMAENFGAVQGQLMGSMQTNYMRLSSVVDGIILLRYVERKQKVEKLLNILKMRGVKHSRDIFRYEIGKGGLRIYEKFKG